MYHIHIAGVVGYKSNLDSEVLIPIGIGLKNKVMRNKSLSALSLRSASGLVGPPFKRGPQIISVHNLQSPIK